MPLYREGSAEIEVPVLRDSPTRSDEVFFNPHMRVSRDLTVLVLGVFRDRSTRKRVRVVDPMCGTGVRSVRIAREIDWDDRLELVAGDISERAMRLAEKNLERNGVRARIEKSDANILVRTLAPCDYVDVDPFGTPAPFVESCVASLSPFGLSGVTATDTSALAGSHPMACKRKYCSVPLKSGVMHETATRILAGFIASACARLERGFEPVFCLARRHFVRVFFVSRRGSSRANNTIERLGFFVLCRSCGFRSLEEGLVPEDRKCPECGSKMEIAGPLWCGQLFSVEWVKDMRKEEKRLVGNGVGLDSSTGRILETAEEEASLVEGLVLDVHELSGLWGVRPPSMSCLREELAARGYKFSRSVFGPTLFRTNAPVGVLRRVFVECVA